MRDVFSRRIAELRKRKNLTQEKMAAEFGITRQSLSLYEKGERIPDIEILRVICEKMDCSPNYLLGFQDTIKDCDRNITEETGLSESAVEFMRKMKQYARITSKMFESDKFWFCIRMIERIAEYKSPEYVIEEKSFAMDNDLLIDFEDAHRYGCHRLLDYIIDDISSSEEFKYYMTNSKENMEAE